MSVVHNIYRYKLSESIIELIKEFTDIHKYDDRKTYKEAWLQYCKENEEVISREENRLIETGYKGNVMDKMFKSGRYYYIKKKNNTDKVPVKRREYITMDNDIINKIDIHIQLNMTNKDYKPANGYMDFINNNDKMIKDEKERILSEYNNIDEKSFYLKIKKTYKNRYYMLSRI
jgi:hypothetical protein